MSWTHKMELCHQPIQQVLYNITHQVPISNSQLCGYEVIMSNDDETYEVILLKIHSVQETLSEHESLA